jgi:hypothetical protein
MDAKFLTELYATTETATVRQYGPKADCLTYTCYGQCNPGGLTP